MTLPLVALAALAAVVAVVALHRWQRARAQRRRCRRCSRYAVPHATPYDLAGRVCLVAPLCERCYADLGIFERRWPYYLAEFDAARGALGLTIRDLGRLHAALRSESLRRDR